VFNEAMVTVVLTVYVQFSTVLHISYQNRTKYGIISHAYV